MSERSVIPSGAGSERGYMYAVLPVEPTLPESRCDSREILCREERIEFSNVVVQVWPTPLGVCQGEQWQAFWCVLLQACASSRL